MPIIIIHLALIFLLYYSSPYSLLLTANQELVSLCIIFCCLSVDTAQTLSYRVQIIGLYGGVCCTLLFVGRSTVSTVYARNPS